MSIPLMRGGTLSLASGSRLPTKYYFFKMKSRENSGGSRYGLKLRKNHAKSSIIKSPILPAVLALVGGLLGTLLGQKMSAATEADKVIRVKLEEAYFNVASLPSLAEDLHAAALEPVTQENFYSVVLRYDSARVRFRDRVSRVNATSELDEPKIGSTVREVITCANKFTKTIGDLSLLQAEKGGKLIVHPRSYSNPEAVLTLPEALNAAVAVKMSCQGIEEGLKSEIASAMKGHL